MKRRTLALILILALLLAVPALAAETAPDDGMATRGDVVKWLYSEYGADFPAEETNLVFTDVPADSGEAEAVAWAAGLGIAKGYGDGRFGPNDPVTREQAAAMLYRFAQAAGQGFQGLWMFLLNYPDASEVSAWADEAMHWVVMNGILTGAAGDDGAELLAPKDGIGVNELPVWIKRLDDTLATTLENGGYTLTIPVNYASRLNTELLEDMPEGTLFAVAEQASIDAAKAQGYDGDGAGWLFAIQKISDAEAKQMLTEDMSGREIFARDEAGDHFLFCTPTDVRFERATAEEMMADSDVWAALNEWASTVKDSFINDNGLNAEYFGNSDVEIWLYRAAYAEDAAYTLSTTAYGPLEPMDGVDAASYVELALKDVAFEYLDGEEAPDGEYVVLKFEGGDRIDFFTGEGGNTVRRVVDLGDGETFELLYKAVYDDDTVVLHDIMEAWYMDLAEAHGQKPTAGPSQAEYEVPAWLELPEGAQWLTNRELAEWGAWFSMDFMRCQFLYSTYAVPQDVNLAETFYNGIRTSDGGGEAADLTDIRAYMMKYGEWSTLTDADKLPTEKMDEILKDYLGLGLEEMSGYGLYRMNYVEETDCYYHFHGDTNRMGDPIFDWGWQQGDFVTLFYPCSVAGTTAWYDGEFRVVLEQTPGDWRFRSNEYCDVVDGKVTYVADPDTFVSDWEPAPMNVLTLEADEALSAADFDTALANVLGRYGDGVEEGDSYCWMEGSDTPYYIFIIGLTYAGDTEAYFIGGDGTVALLPIPADIEPGTVYYETDTLLMTLYYGREEGDSYTSWVYTLLVPTGELFELVKW